MSSTRRRAPRQRREPDRSTRARTGDAGRDGYEREARAVARRITTEAGSRADRAVAARDRQASDGLPAPVPIRAVNRSLDVVRRALALNHTTWADADQIFASEGGAGGVIFIGDPGGNVLVVKPNVRGAEEQLSAALHHQMATTNKANSWKLGELPMRIATQADVDDIRDRADELWVGQRPARLVTLLAALAPGTTMIQESAPGGSKTLGRAMSDKTAEGSHFGTNAKQKVHKDSPLKPLFNKPDYAETLGRAAAADIFMGNWDRLVGTLGNIENLMVSAPTKQIFLIDNIGANVSQDIFDTQGDGQAEFTAWANNPWVAALKAGQVHDIASDVWSDQGPNFGALITLQEMLITGARTDQQDQQHAFLSQGDQATMRAKLARSQNRHLNTIIANFANGLTAGLVRIAASGAALAAGAGPNKVRRMADARRRFLTANQTAAAAWQAALLAYP